MRGKVEGGGRTSRPNKFSSLQVSQHHTGAPGRSRPAEPPCCWREATLNHCVDRSAATARPHHDRRTTTARTSFIRFSNSTMTKPSWRAMASWMGLLGTLFQLYRRSTWKVGGVE